MRLPVMFHRVPALRWSMAITLLTISVGMNCSAPTVLAAQSASRPPNIVFILIDDMGWPDVTCYGHQFHETPTIDKLCQQGMKFTDFYAATPVCSSTRCTLQSGQHAARVGITDFIPGHMRPFEKLIVPPIENATKAKQAESSDQRPGPYVAAHAVENQLATG